MRRSCVYFALFVTRIIAEERDYRVHCFLCRPIYPALPVAHTEPRNARHLGDLFLRADVPLFSEIENASAQTAAREEQESTIENLPLLLAPLDPIIYDRRVTAALWDFDYTWEAYPPSVKRVRGYYALPILAGTEIVGHLDPKADRAQRKLTVASRRIRRGHRIAPALDHFAVWLGLGRR